MKRRIRLHAFCSVKGGVGKSTLALVSARMLAARGEPCLLIDADMTGTSLADGLPLIAPDVPVGASGKMDLATPSMGRYLGLEASRQARDLRRGSVQGAMAPPPFFNDILSFHGEGGEDEVHLPSLIWKDVEDSGVSYLPSSSLEIDVLKALTWLYKSDDHLANWAKRFAWILEAAASQMPRIDNIMVDLPPGIFGFSAVFLGFLNLMSSGLSMPETYPQLKAPESPSWDVSVFLVTSQDRQDLLVAMEAYGKLSKLVPIFPLVNRLNIGLNEVKSWANERLGMGKGDPVFQSLAGIARNLVAIDEVAELRRIFSGGAIDFGKLASSDLPRQLRIGG